MHQVGQKPNSVEPPVNLHRVTPIPEVTPLTGRVSSTPSVGSIPEEPDEDNGSLPQDQKVHPLQERKSSGAAKRLPLVAESLQRIPELSVGRSDLAGLSAYRPAHQRSRSASPSASERSDTSAPAFRTDSLHRTTPIPTEAAGSLSAQSSFSSMRRNRRGGRAPTISEDGELGDSPDFGSLVTTGGLTDRQDSIQSSGSLHRPTPIPLDMLAGNRSLGRRSGNRSMAPTIHEVDYEATSAEDTDLARQNEALFGSQADGAGPQLREETVPPNSQRKAMTASRDAPLLVNSTPRDDASGAQPLLDDASLPQGPSLQSNEQRYDSASSHSGQIARNDLKTGMDASGTQQATPAHGRNQSLGQISEGYTPKSTSSLTPLLDNRDSERDMVGVARFLRLTPGLSRQVIGELLGENNERCIRVLDLFTASFDFKGLTFEAALREYLESFRLPGESQKIFRILEAFSRHFFQQCGTGVFKSQDAVLTLGFSLILLNTDLHNHQVRKKMTKEEFVRNTAGTNEKSDFPRDFLEMLYSNIERRALRIPPAHPQGENVGRSSSLPEAARKTQERYQSPAKTKKTSFFCF